MPTTAIPRGRSTLLNIGFESTLGAPPSASNYSQLNAYQMDNQRSRALVADDVLGVFASVSNTFDARPAAPNVEDATGKFSVPLSLIEIGFWLKLATGQDTVSGSGAFSHAFASGSQLASATLERVFAAAQFDALTGAVLKSIKFPFKPGSGYNQIDVDLVGIETLEPYTTSLATSPTSTSVAPRVPNSVAVLKIGGTQAGRILEGAFTLTNDIDAERYVGGGAFPSDIILNGQDVAVDLTVRYTDDTVSNFGALGTATLPPVMSVEVDYVVGAASLGIVLPAVRFEPVNKPVQNGKTITQTLKGRAEGAASGAMFQATLINTRSTVY